MYRNSEKFNNDYFEEELLSKFDLNNKDCTTFKNILANVLIKQGSKRT